MNFIIVFFGAGIGAVIRYIMTNYGEKIGYKIAATFFINIFGTIILALILKQFGVTSFAYLFIGTGFCGGFTTFSTFNSEIISLFFGKGKLLCVIYFIGSYLFGIIAGLEVFLIK